jgi:hypothetical protein
MADTMTSQNTDLSSWDTQNVLLESQRGMKDAQNY